MIDLHAHVLPGFDDGPQTLEDALAMARLAASAGTRVIATTSHVDDRFGQGPQAGAAIAAAREAVRDAFAVEGIELVAGAEIALERFLDLDDAALESLALGTGRCLLVEPPFSVAAGALEPVCLSLLDRGWRVLVAHPERCPAFHRGRGMLERLVEAGVLLQVTAPSLAGVFGGPAERVAMDLVVDGLAHVLASDAHDLERRPPDLRPGVQVVDEIAPGLSDWMTRAVPAALLAGEPIPPRPEVEPMRRRRGLFSR